MDLMLQRLVRFGKKRKVNLPLALICVLFLYAVSVMGDCAERLGKALRGKPARRLAAAALSLCLVFHFAPVTALADVPDASTTPEIQGGGIMRRRSPVHWTHPQAGYAGMPTMKNAVISKPWRALPVLIKTRTAVIAAPLSEAATMRTVTTPR